METLFTGGGLGVDPGQNESEGILVILGTKIIEQGHLRARLDRFPGLPGSHHTSQVTAGLVEFLQQPSVWLLGQVDPGCTESMFGCLYEMRIQIADASTWTFGWLHACC